MASGEVRRRLHERAFEVKEKPLFLRIFSAVDQPSHSLFSAKQPSHAAMLIEDLRRTGGRITF